MTSAPGPASSITLRWTSLGTNSSVIRRRAPLEKRMVNDVPAPKRYLNVWRIKKKNFKMKTVVAAEAAGRVVVVVVVAAVYAQPRLAGMWCMALYGWEKLPPSYRQILR